MYQSLSLSRSQPESTIFTPKAKICIRIRACVAQRNGTSTAVCKASIPTLGRLTRLSTARSTEVTLPYEPKIS